MNTTGFKDSVVGVADSRECCVAGAGTSCGQDQCASALTRKGRAHKQDAKACKGPYVELYSNDAI